MGLEGEATRIRIDLSSSQATLRDGTPVVLKVQRPGIETLIETDILILESFARRRSVRFPNGGSTIPGESSMSSRTRFEKSSISSGTGRMPIFSGTT